MRKNTIIIRIIMIGIVGGMIYGFLMIPFMIQKLFPRKSINILAWPAAIDASEFHIFEKETGIKVYLTYFENYEELVIKMRSGTGDYDVIMSADYAVSLLLKEGVVKPIDKEKLSFWKDLQAPLLDLSFDPGNKYTIPFAWEMYGLGINKTAFDGKVPQASWGLLFDETMAPPNVGMLNDAREVISIAALYLFGKKPHQALTQDQLDQIKELLLAQKKWVSTYTDLRTDYLLISQSSPVVVGVSSDIHQAMREYKTIDFYIPKEGSFVLVDLFMISATTQKDDFVYQFLNFIYRPDIQQVYADRYHFFPVLKDVGTKQNRHSMTPTHDMFSYLSFFDYVIPEEAMRSLWIALKS